MYIFTEDYTCPFCGKHTTITSETFSASRHELSISNATEIRSVLTQFRVCPNPQCRRASLSARVYVKRSQITSGEFISQSWELIPPSNAKAFPDYIPLGIRQDYEEACLIVTLSPKASATLARRCLQGMIRDFWRITKTRLFDEIAELESKVDPETWAAIDGLRSIGNIGAHMEKDVNLVVDVEPDEAKKLIWLIELLIEEWYVHRHERQERLKAVKSLAAEKDLAKKVVPPPAVKP